MSVPVLVWHGPTLYCKNCSYEGDTNARPILHGGHGLRSASVIGHHQWAFLAALSAGESLRCILVGMTGSVVRHFDGVR